MAANGSVLRITTGQQDWSAGVDSDKTPTIASAQNPNGLKPNQLAWGNNITVRGGSISPRFGLQDLAAFAVGIGIHQESYMYQPRFAFPYIISQIAGRTFAIHVENDPVTIVEITIAGDPNPPNIEQAWMTQGEEFLIIQDGVSEPLVWDGNVLRRISAMGGTPPYLRTAESMVYYQGRIWEALGREYWAGDIVGNPAALGSGTAAYGGRDAILHMVENTFTSLGGSFTVPTTAGNIRALNYPANINNFLGQGPLLIFTRQQIYAADIPISRTDWVATNNNTGITVKVAQINFGTTSDRSVVHVNGDVFYQSVDGVRSLFTAVRNFGEWGDLPISVEEARAIQFNDRALLRFGSGITFDNRLLETALPFQTDVGVCHKGILPLNFDLVSTLAEKKPPAWEGILEGLDILRLVRGDFGGRERAFALARSSITGGIVVYELTSYLLEDNNTTGNARITWSFETPSFSFGDPFALKELDTVEYWCDKISGDVEVAWQMRPDQHGCWEPWWKHKICAPRNNCEDCGVLLPDECYPTQFYKQQYRATIVLPKPPTRCETSQHRPINLGYSFQFRVFVKGSMRIRGIMVHAFPKDKAPYASVTDVCSSANCGT
jgi:hypothetical protein